MSLQEVVLKAVANGSAPGPSGWTGEMLRTVVLDQESRAGFTLMVQALLEGAFDGCEDVRALLLCSHLVLIEKKKPNGQRSGIRPIAMGEALWKTVVCCVRQQMGPSAMLELVGSDIQFGVACPGGSERAVLKIQSALDSNVENVAILADISNAFNTRERADIAAELYSNKEAALLWRVFRFSYGAGASPLLVFGEKGQCKHVQASSNGVRQGDPLSSLLFAISMRKIYEFARDGEAGAAVFLLLLIIIIIICCCCWWWWWWCCD